MRGFCAALLISWLAAALNSAAAQGTELIQNPGLHKLMLEQAGIRYSLSIPESYDGETRVPLILALHYGGVVTPFYGAGLLTSLVEPALRDTGAIMVAPDNEGAGWDNVSSEARVMKLLRHLFDNYAIDRRRLVVTGYSLGGIGTWYHLSRHPALFSAGIPVSGRAPLEIEAAHEEVPVFVIHGDRDEVFPIAAVETAVDTLRARAAAVTFEVVEGAVHYDVAGFQAALRTAVPWLEGVWRENAGD